MSWSLTKLSTAAAMIVLAAYAVFRGVMVVLFVGASWQASANPEQALERLQPWFDVPGVAATARNEAVRNLFDLKVLRDQYTGIVMESPFTPRAWAALAGVETLSSETRSQAVQYLTMATILAPNEFGMMATRAKIGVALWEDLPPERRMSVIKDLGFGGREGVFNENRPEIVAIVASKSPEVRDEIRDYLIRYEGATPELLAYIGFSTKGLPRPGG